MPDHIYKTTCRICGGSDLVEILDLGTTPPANAYRSKEELLLPEASFPLVLYFCNTCSLAQLLHVVNPEILFKNYHFLTGASAPSIAHFQQYAQHAVLPHIQSPEDLIIDIGGNDGVLLSFLKDHARVLNVDPADNLAALSNARGVPFYTAFFTSAVADELVAQYGQAKVITANNVFAHTDPLQDVFAGVASLLREDGVFIFEVHWAKHLLADGCFDQMYHEHLCFHSLHALTRLVENSGMHIFDVEIVPMQGQSLRVYVSKRLPKTSRVEAILAEEKAAGLTTADAFHAFAKTVRANKDAVVTLLQNLKAQGKKIVGYGAPAKGNTLLNYYQIGTETLDYITDTTVLKQGLYTPGTHIPIVPPERLYTETPDYVLLLAWNFKDAILEKEKPLRDKGVQFIITAPDISIV